MPGTALAPEVRSALAAIYGLLVFATVLARLFPAPPGPEGEEPEFAARVSGWWVVVLSFTGALAAGPGVAIGFFAFVSFLALKEYLSMIPSRRVDRRVLFWAYLSIPLQYWAVWQGDRWLFLVLVPVYMFMVLPLRMVSLGETEGFLAALGTLFWGVMLTVFSLSHVALLLTLELPGAPGRASGPGLVVFLVALTQLGEIAGRLTSRTRGTGPMLPSVAHGKTRLGFLAALAVTTVLGWRYGPLLTPLTSEQSMLAGFGIGVFGFLGDLTVSAVKRDLGIEHTSSMLPGHGGILDRVNGLTFTSMLFLHYLWRCCGGIPPVNHFLRFLFYALVMRPLLLIVIGLNVRHRHRLPRTGPAIVIANHNSNLDAMALMCLVPLARLPRYQPVGAQDYWFSNRLMAWFSSRVVGVVPLDRQARGARETVLAPVVEALDRGQVVILFPEGTRGEPEQLQPFKTGIAWLAEQRPEVPVHPVFMHGLGKVLPRGEALLVPIFCDIFIGEPLRWTGEKDGFMAELTRRVTALAAEGSFPPWT